MRSAERGEGGVAPQAGGFVARAGGCAGVIIIIIINNDNNNILIIIIIIVDAAIGRGWDRRVVHRSIF